MWLIHSLLHPTKITICPAFLSLTTALEAWKERKIASSFKAFSLVKSHILSCAVQINPSSFLVLNSISQSNKEFWMKFQSWKLFGNKTQRKKNLYLKHLLHIFSSQIQLPLIQRNQQVQLRNRRLGWGMGPSTQNTCLHRDHRHSSYQAAVYLHAGETQHSQPNGKALGDLQLLPLHEYLLFSEISTKFLYHQDVNMENVWLPLFPLNTHTDSNWHISDLTLTLDYRLPLQSNISSPTPLKYPRITPNLPLQVFSTLQPNLTQNNLSYTKLNRKSKHLFHFDLQQAFLALSVKNHQNLFEAKTLANFCL